MHARHRGTGEAFALKIISKATTPEVLHENEVRVLSAAGPHRHIASLVDHFEVDSAWGLVLELAAGGEVFDRVCKEGAYSEHTAAVVVRQVAEALRHLHSRGIVHRDLKPENLLLSSPEGHADVLLCDFGMARFVGLGAPPLTSRAGTLAYMAPEMMDCGPYGPQVDVWALGVITFLLLSGYHPFNPSGTLDEASIEKRIISGQWNFDGECWDYISEDARDLIRRMLHPDPGQRLKVSELLASPWIAGGKAPDVPLPPGTAEELRAFNAARHKWRTAIRALALVGCGSPGPGGGRTASAPLTSLDLPACALAELREAFDACDRNSNGAIEMEELVGLISRLGASHFTAERALRSATRCATDVINFDQFCAVVGPLYAHSQAVLRDTFDLFDVDGSGEIDKSELCRMLNKLFIKNADIDAMFADADTDGDGRISFNEYVSMFAE